MTIQDTILYYASIGAKFKSIEFRSFKNSIKTFAASRELDSYESDKFTMDKEVKMHEVFDAESYQQMFFNENTDVNIAMIMSGRLPALVIVV